MKAMPCKRMTLSKSRSLTIRAENACIKRKQKKQNNQKEQLYIFLIFTNDWKAICIKIVNKEFLKYTILYKYHESNVMQKKMDLSKSRPITIRTENACIERKQK